jgi:hypothetical protein
MVAPTATVESIHPVASVKFYAGAATIGETPPTITTYDPLVSGAVALTNTLATVAGTGTNFLTDFSVNDYVIFTSQPTALYRIAIIASNISMTLTSAYTGATIVGTTVRSVTVYPSYSVAWINVQPGSYVLKAVVTDILGATATSPLVTVLVSGVITGLPSTALSGSSIGFGRNPFGQHQFGFGDWAEQMLWGNLPQVYKDCDEVGPTGSAVSQPLRQFQNALKPSYQELRVRWHEFLSLWDAIRVPLDQLTQLGYNVGITVDSTKPEGLQRSSVLNASQLWINKGNDKGYQITAAFEGLLVTITPLWAKSCAAASQVLGTVGLLPASFDLASTVVESHPVSPETFHVRVTTSFNIVEDIYDDGAGVLIGRGNQLNGPLTRLNISPTTTLLLTSIVGLFNVGDIVTQGLSSGIIVASVGANVTLQVTAGTFGLGAVLDTNTAATATVTSTTANVLVTGETFVGLTTGTTGVMRDFESTYMVVDRITTLAGFSVGETLLGLTSGRYAVAGTSTILIEGPLRAKLSLSAVIGSFTVGDQITGGTSGAIGVVREVSPTVLYVDTITSPGFSVAETISIGLNSATVNAITYGSINYLTGELLGHTVDLATGSEIEAIVDLITTGPTQFVANYDVVIGDEIPMDRIESDRYSRWPVTYEPIRIVNGVIAPGECRSHSLRLFFYTPDDTEIEDFTSVASRIQQALETFRPIHVQFDKISFDGARASSQVWRTGAVAAESSAAAVWTASVIGNQQVSSQVWTTGPFSATVSL